MRSLYNGSLGFSLDNSSLDARSYSLTGQDTLKPAYSRIQGMATQSNLTIRGFAPQAVATRSMYAEWPIGLQIEGTYHNLGNFLERVSKFPRIINVSGIHIKSKTDGTPGDSITAECTATTFVLQEGAARGAHGH